MTPARRATADYPGGQQPLTPLPTPASVTTSDQLSRQTSGSEHRSRHDQSTANQTEPRADRTSACRRQPARSTLRSWHPFEILRLTRLDLTAVTATAILYRSLGLTWNRGAGAVAPYLEDEENAVECQSCCA
jgi:hypothetical protein